MSNQLELNSYIANLRQKLRDVSDQTLIHTEGSQGYRLLIALPNDGDLTEDAKAGSDKERDEFLTGHR